MSSPRDGGRRSTVGGARGGTSGGWPLPSGAGQISQDSGQNRCRGGHTGAAAASLTLMTATSTRSSALQHRWLVLGLLGTGQLMLILDVTVVAIALPHMGTGLGVSREVLTWVVSGYSLAFGSLLLGGWAADRFGPKSVVLAGLGVFTAASLAAGLAETGPVLLS